MRAHTLINIKVLSNGNDRYRTTPLLLLLFFFVIALLPSGDVLAQAGGVRFNPLAGPSGTADYMATEGDTVNIVVERFGTPSELNQTVVLTLSVIPFSNATADEGTDFNVSSASVTWAAGESGTRTIPVQILTDNVLEPVDEQFFLRMVSNVNERQPNVARILIVDIPPVITVNAGMVQFTSAQQTVSEAGGPVTLTVSRAGGSDGAASVQYTITDPSGGTRVAVPGGVVGTLNWLDGDSTNRSIVLNVIDNSDIDGDIDVLATLSNAAGVGLGALTTSTISIIDDEIPNTVQFTPATYAVSESDGSVTITMSVARPGGVSGVVNISVLASPGGSSNTATFPDDYGQVSGDFFQLNWGANQTGTRSFTIDISGDSDDTEGPETFVLDVVDVFGADVTGPSTALVTIQDSAVVANPGVIDMDEDIVSVIEGDAPGTISVLVNRTGGSDGVVAVSFIVTDGSAVLGEDYSGTTSGTLTWVDGDSLPKTIVLVIVDDFVEEAGDITGREFFQVNLSNATGGASLGSGLQTEVAISDDDDGGNLLFNPPSYFVLEDQGMVMVSVDRINGSDGAVTATFELQSLVAIAGVDFEFIGGIASVQLNWVHGESGIKSFPVTIISDMEVESLERGRVRFVDAVGAQIVSSFANIDIDDAPFVTPPTATVQFVSAIQAVDEGQSVTIELIRQNDLSQTVFVMYDITAGNAIFDTDFTGAPGASGLINFAPNQTSATLVYDIANDALVEGLEEFTLTLSPGASSAVDIGAVASTIIEISDTTVTPPVVTGEIAFDMAVYTVLEGQAINVTAIRRGGSVGEIRARIQLQDPDGNGSATIDEDFENPTPVFIDVVWPDGDSTPRSFIINTLDDTDGSESDEDLFVEFFVTSPIPEAPHQGLPDVARVVIQDVPPANPIIQFSQASYSVTEDDVSISLVVERLSSNSGFVEVEYEVTGGTAVHGQDFADAPPLGLVRWADGDGADKTIDFTIARDFIPGEGDEDFTVGLFPFGTGGAGVPFTIGTPDETTVTISDTTQIGEVQLVETDYSVFEDQGAVTVQLERINGDDGPLTLVYSLINGTATFNSDYGNPSDNTIEVWQDGESGIRNIGIEILDDTLIEIPDETFTVEITSAVGISNNFPATILTPRAVVTILAVPVLATGTVQFDPDTYNVAEADGAVSLTVTRTGGNTGEATVMFTTIAGSASANVDFVPMTGTLTWPAGTAGDQTITVAINGDADTVPLEDFTVVLSSATGATLGTPDVATVTIADSTSNVDIVMFADASISVLESVGTLDVIVQRVGDALATASVDYEITAGTASLTDDINPAVLTDTLSWLATDNTTRTISIPIVAENLIENDETFTITLLSAVGPLIGTPASTEVTIENDDFPVLSPGTVQFAQVAVSVDEDNGPAVLTVTRTGGSDGAISVLVNTDAGSAALGADYTNTAVTLDWADNDSSSRSVSIPINNDALVEGAENFTVNLMNASPSDAVIGSPATATVTINDTTPLPGPDLVQFTDVQFSTLESAGTLDIVVARQGSEGSAASVSYTLNAGTASLSNDLSSAMLSGTVSWAQGNFDNQLISIPINDDNLDESNENFTVVLSQPVGVDLGTPTTTTATIVDNDDPVVAGTVQFNLSSIAVAENVGSAVLVVTRVGGSDGQISAIVDTDAGTAASGADYTNTTMTLTWGNGDVSNRMVEIPINFDTLVEGNESFTVNLMNGSPTDSVIGSPATAIVTINDVFNGNPGTLQFADDAISVDEDAGFVTVFVNRVGGADGAVSVGYDTDAGSATLGADYANTTGMLNWANNDGEPKSFQVAIVNDGVTEANENFFVTLQNAQPLGDNVQLGSPTSSTVTIINSDPPVVVEPPPVLVPGMLHFAQPSLTVDENVGVVTISVLRTGGTDGDVSVQYGTGDGGALAGNDFEAGNGTLFWSSGDMEPKSFTLNINEDADLESVESFTVSLANAMPSADILGTPDVLVISINDTTVAPPELPPVLPEPILDPGVLRFTQQTISMGESAGTFLVSVLRMGGSDGDISVDFGTSSGSAQAGTDFQSTSGTLFWSDGDIEAKSIEITINSDDQIEDTEAFSVSLVNGQPMAGLIGSPDTLTISILDETLPEPVGMLSFAEADVSVDEVVGSVQLQVVRTGGSNGSVSVNYQSVDGSAESESDYSGVSGTLVWSDGDTSARIITVPILTDANVEDIEQFQVVLSGALPSGDPEQLGLAAVTVSIADSTSIGTISFVSSAVTVAEADTSVDLIVMRSSGADGSVSVDYTLLAGTAQLGSDVVDQSGTLQWDSGDDSNRVIQVQINADTQPESDEQFSVVLTNALPLGDALQIDVGQATVTITDSTRTGFIQVQSQTVTVQESSAEAVVVIERIEGSDGSASVDYTLIAQSATAGEDYTEVSGTLTWNDGESGIRTVQIPILSDDQIEQTESLLLRLSNALPLGEVQLRSDEVQVLIEDSTVAVVTPVEPPVIEPPGTTPEMPFNDIPPLDSLGSLALVIVSGDGQGGVPGDILEPLVIDVIDTGTNNATVSGVPIRWRANPVGSALLLDPVQTVSDVNGRTSMRVQIVSRGFLNIIAAVDVAPGASAAAARIAAPIVPAGPGEAVFTVRSGFLAADGLRSNQSAIGGAFDQICEVLTVRLANNEMLSQEEQDLFATCQELEARLANDALGEALDRLTPEELFFIGDSIIDTADIQVTNVYARINAIRSGQVETLDLAGLNLMIYDQNIPGSVVNAAQNELSGGGAAADDGFGSRLGVFANGAVSFGEVDGAENQRGSEFTTSGITVGFDYRFTDNAVAGAGLGFVRNNTEFNPDDGTADLDGLSVTLFGTWYQAEKGYVDGVIDIGRNHYDIRRQINLPGTLEQFAHGETDADVLSITVGAGRDWSRNGWEFGPYGRFSHTTAEVDAYSENATSETVGFGSVLNIRSHSVRSTTLSIGGQVSRTVNTKRGVFVPQFRLEAEFESEENKGGIEATFQHDPTQTAFSVNGNDRDTSYINLGIGSSALLPNGKSGYLFYETQLQNDYVTQHWLKLGLRLEF